MSKKVAILQSNYIPWKGYFDMINRVDEFILYDDMQYTRRDWRNRNKIKTANGLQWLTIPVDVKGKYYQKINETVIKDLSWASKHWTALTHNYKKASYFDVYADSLEALYQDCSDISLLSEVNHRFICYINDILGIKTKISWSSDYELEDGKSERLLGLCKSAGADKYISGPAAQGYLDVNIFENDGIKVEWMDYSGYPEYSQLYGTFEHGVSILDLLMNEGENAKNVMKTFPES